MRFKFAAKADATAAGTDSESDWSVNWMGVVIAMLIFGLLMGYYVSPPNYFAPHASVSDQPASISGKARTLILDALQAQANARAGDPRFDDGQRQTIKLLILPKLDEYRAKAIDDGDLAALASLYDLIEQPNGLRAERK